MHGPVRKGAPEVSAIVAVRDEEDSIGWRVRQVAEHLRGLGRRFEILAVNDGCFDTSFAVLRLVAAEVPELRLLPAYAAERAFLRGVAAAEGQQVLLFHGGRRPVFGALAWALRRVEDDLDAVVARGHWIAARRLACLGVLTRIRGRGEPLEQRFEREAAGLRLQVAGRAQPPTSLVASLLAPVRRLLEA
jgi:hypothetical protein